MRNYKEALVVVAMAAVMVFCGAVTFNSAMDKQVFCKNNLMKLYQYNQMYINEYGELPPVVLPQKPLWKFWRDYLKQFRKSSTDFTCPCDPKGAAAFAPVNPLLQKKAKKQILKTSYGMNWFLCRDYSKKKKIKHPRLNDLTNPAGVVFLGDSKGPYMLPPRYWEFEAAFWHENSSANFIFADGSVRNMVKKDFGTTGADGKFQTNFALWKWN